MGYSALRLRRLLGKLNWASRPALGAHPFLSGSYLWLHKGPQKAHFTPARVLRGLAEALAISLFPWMAKPPPPPKPLWFTDAAFDGAQFWCSIWHTELGFRIYQAPPWITSQQSAELYSITVAARIAAFRGLPAVSIASDNLAALYALLHCRASPSAKAHTHTSSVRCSTRCAGLESPSPSTGCGGLSIQLTPRQDGFPSLHQQL